MWSRYNVGQYINESAEQEERLLTRPTTIAQLKILLIISAG
ncbi:unnamed protein product [Brugia timori]|uniref:Transposase n=1 Tax=Brugia timori TaxID=42155 RepID=A0A0R3R319_9BILA|nr:unnamed protein product [Brugia timori]